MLTEIEIKRNQGVDSSQEYENMHDNVSKDSLNSFSSSIDSFQTALDLIPLSADQFDSLIKKEWDDNNEGNPQHNASGADILRLQEKVRKLTEENQQLKDRAPVSDPKSLFDALENISMNVLAPILEHEATDGDSRTIARQLGVRPDELRHYLLKGNKTYLDAIAELEPFLYAAKRKLLERKKRGAAENRNDHRAKLLIEKLELRSEIRVDQARDIIDGDEGVRPSNMVVRRAMKKAAKIRPDMVEFITCCPGCSGSKLRRR